MRKICIEESFEIAVNDAMEEWKDDDNFKYFSEKEQQVANYLFSMKNKKIQQVINPSK
jgi:hypothetical protein